MSELKGIITKGVGGKYMVFASGAYYTCTPRGIFRNRNLTPLVGDNVEITVTDSESMLGILHTLHPRNNYLVRPPVANIDQVIITVATASPAFNAGLLDRFIVMAAHQGIHTIICVNKADIKIDSSFQPYIAAGYTVVYTSAVAGTGLDVLLGHMAGKVSVFAGPSGVGKSSLLNCLNPQLQLETGVLSTKLARGKHTTRHSQIFPLNVENGYCVDTPGFTSLEVDDIPKNALAALFLEFVPHIGNCKYYDCMHLQERDCAVKAQVGHTISQIRYESYVNLAQKTRH